MREMEIGISTERALELIREYVRPVGVEQISADAAHGRVLAQDVCAPMDQPPWPRSPLDGYALRASDSDGGSASLRVVGTLCAGSWTDETVKPGECFRIMTGAPIPNGCDCVIRQEDTDQGFPTVQLRKTLKPWENYCFAGDDFHQGDVLLRSGTRLRGNALGVLASAGLYHAGETLTVYRAVRCAVLCTGDELVPSGVRPLPQGKIYSSNEAVIPSRLRELGCTVTLVQGSFQDDPAALADAIRKACASADVIFTTGGVSVGMKDILHETLPLLDAQRVFWRVRQKPGTPLMFSLLDGVPILSLSGNPFAASATFEMFGRELLACRAGCGDLRPLRAEAVLETAFPKFGKGRRFVRGVFCDGRVSLPRGHSSGQLASAVGANCLAEIPPSDAPLSAGKKVQVWLL